MTRATPIWSSQGITPIPASVFIAVAARSHIGTSGPIRMPVRCGERWTRYKSCSNSAPVRTASLPTAPDPVCSIRSNAVPHPACRPLQRTPMPMMWLMPSVCWKARAKCWCASSRNGWRPHPRRWTSNGPRGIEIRLLHCGPFRGPATPRVRSKMRILSSWNSAPD